MTIPRNRALQAIEGRERPADLPDTIRKIEGRWFGDACASFEGADVKLVYCGLNDQIGNGAFSSHAHPFAELFYTLSGQGTLITERGIESCRKGHIYLAHPGDRHASQWSTSVRTPWRSLIFQFDMEVKQDLAADADLTLAQQVAPFFSYFFLNRHSTYCMDDASHAAFRRHTQQTFRLIQQFPEAGASCVVGMWLLLISLVSGNLRNSGLASSKGTVFERSQKERQLLKAKQILQDSENDAMDITAVAEAVGMSEYHFIREFHQAFDVSPQRFRHGLGMERAGKLLTQTDLPVYAVAESAGYVDASAFSKSFRKHFGLSPQQYRTNWNKVK